MQAFMRFRVDLLRVTLALGLTGEFLHLVVVFAFVDIF